MAVVYRETIIRQGLSFGAALAMAVSFTLNKSIFWAIIHGILGWLYVLYAALFKTYWPGHDRRDLLAPPGRRARAAGAPPGPTGGRVAGASGARETGR